MTTSDRILTCLGLLLFAAQFMCVGFMLGYFCGWNSRRDVKKDQEDDNE